MLGHIAPQSRVIPWWVKPSLALAAVPLPALIITYFLPDTWFRYFGLPNNALNLNGLSIGIVSIASMCLGVGAAAATTGRHPRPIPNRAFLQSTDRHLASACNVLFALCMAAYGIWFAELAKNPIFLYSIILGEPAAAYQGKLMFQRVPGVTSLTQLGPVYVTIFMARWLYTAQGGVPRSGWFCFFTILLAALVRSLAYSERLAFIEVLMPVAILAFRSVTKYRLVLAFLPGLFIMFGFFVFALSEYGRSWSSAYQYREESFWRFAALRFLGYYGTSISNGAGVLDYSAGAIGPAFTFAWFWQFPLDFGQRALFSGVTAEHASMLRTYLYGRGSPEFNTFSGVFVPLIDYGVVGGSAYMFAAGVVIGACYRGYRWGSLGGMLTYPCLYVSLIEMPRILYFSSVRYFPTAAATVLVLVWIWGRVRQIKEA